jgi:hypothetical protein
VQYEVPVCWVSGEGEMATKVIGFGAGCEAYVMLVQRQRLALKFGMFS